MIVPSSSCVCSNLGLMCMTTKCSTTIKWTCTRLQMASNHSKQHQTAREPSVHGDKYEQNTFWIETCFIMEQTSPNYTALISLLPVLVHYLSGKVLIQVTDLGTNWMPSTYWTHRDCSVINTCILDCCNTHIHTCIHTQDTIYLSLCTTQDGQ
jgi:hypothetical protein